MIESTKEARPVKKAARVVSQEKIAEDIYSMWIKTDVARRAMPGQFISVFANDGSKLLPRPISLCEIFHEADILRIVYRVTAANTGTELFSRLKAGEAIEIMGPLGNGFDLSEKNKLRQVRKVLIIGGGIGVPPMLQLAKEFNHILDKHQIQLLMGYRDEVFLMSDFKDFGSLYIATENGSLGTVGTVMDAIDEFDLSADMIYACGPVRMLRAIKGYAKKNRCTCYLSLEEKMACGVGACLACICRSKEIDPHSNLRQKRICKDGPVFLSTEVEI
ncbi:MAG: dihydroorotate dehydrogenase electron transfer subunit [Lachnospiraceae bacterium]|nr:dihydroorotate dehydrogenase electron transfer subunit [Lachnospiraceae bacterium]